MAKAKAKEAAAPKPAGPDTVRIALDSLWSRCKLMGLGPDTPEGKAYTAAVAAHEAKA